MSEPKVTTQAVHVSAGSNLPVNRVVIHATCPMLGYPKASAAGQAKSTARYFTNAASGGSAHYCEDIAAEEHCVKDSAIAWHAPPNPHSVGVEICADGGSAAAYRTKPEANYTREQWLSPQVWPAVERAALRVRELCDRFDIPKVRLSSKDLLAGKRGICGHVDVSAAWHQTDHSDPGPAFPWDEFMAVVKGGKPQEDDVTPDDIKAIADEVLKRPVDDLYGNRTTVGAAIGVTLRNSTSAALDARAARAIAEASAKAAKPLTAAEIDDIAQATVTAFGADYDAKVELTPKEN